MKQILHIFVKDVRHLWVEILIAQALIVAQFWLGPYQWLVQGPSYGFDQGELLHGASLWMIPLMMITWVLLIARSVHDERLVGDRQFWLTRPYEWKDLLAAKVLFFGAFIYVPFFVLQVVLLAEAGFSPLPWIPRILVSLLFLTTAIILPLVALATVTSSFVRIVLVLVGVLVYALIGAAVSAVKGGSGLGSETSPVQIGNYLTDLLFLLTCGAVILLQYDRHRVLLSRLLLIGVFVAACALDFAAPDRLLINRNYPAMNSQSIAPLSLSIDVYSHGYERDITSLQRRREIFNLRISGIEPGSAMRIDSVKASFDTPDGFRWNSGWQTQGAGADSDLGDSDIRLLVTMPDRVFQRLKGVSSDLTLTVALTQLKAGSTTQLTLPKPMQEFAIPGLGICTPQVGFSGDAQALGCRFPFQAPLALVSARWFDKPCSKSQGDPGILGSGWVGSVTYRAPQFTFVPVQYPAFPLSNSMRFTGRGPESRNLCPGTQVTFTRYELVRRERVSVTASGFRIEGDENQAIGMEPGRMAPQ